MYTFEYKPKPLIKKNLHITISFRKMKKRIWTLICAIVAMSICNAQKIEMKKVYNGYQYTQEGTKMTMKKLVKTMKSEPSALKFIKKARTNKIISSILTEVGGVLIGFPIGMAITGRKADWTLAGIGAGFVVIGIPISISVNRNAKKAIKLYNTSQNTSSYFEFETEYKIVANRNGIGVAMNF